MNARTRRIVLVTGGLTAAVVIGVGGAVVWAGAGPDPGRSPGSKVGWDPEAGSPGTVAQAFLTAFAAGDTTAAAKTTDAEQVAAPALARSKTGMTPASTFQARLGAVPPTTPDAAEAKITADVTWTLPGGSPWSYQTVLDLKRDGKQWRVHWTPALVHPQLTEGQALAFLPQSGDGALLDRDGGPVPKDTGAYAAAIMPGVRTAVGGLAGTPGWKVAAFTPSNEPAATLHEKAAVVTRSATLTLDKAVQDSAQAAVDGVPQQAAIVALDTTSGEVLAVAQNAVATATGPVALAYLHEPGSTFKMITAAAALENGGVTIDTPVECPGEATIGTRRIPNDGRFDLGTVPLRTAFAQSCNTTFGKLAADLPPTALTDAALRFGIGADFTVAGLTTNTGKVPAAQDVASRVENGIGQGRVQTTPFGMALAAATVANGGTTPTPILIREIPTVTAKAPTGLPAGVAQALRPMMREVVTGGTATALAPFGQVFGKTGTAQFGDGTGSHGWFVGYRGTTAFAVLVVDAGSSKAAVGVTAAFLGAL
ncbi:penicillin-binding transpeptidase domain-containing protein [Umezawaea endophytica]|uniref:Penicillin-binding transpeptidase domain-containing protein n=1 Tax=Umezawaea endophytica TaxID=1654476 RepID=A0A9X2VZ94_9PSEU|nr:penicillin-binding transpeptidase domain-containing protein [Umezawaea endophytica]MCS7484704.1 penicillin-binding transpeptidase domain-containing protein [Umezawaea endophytica]